MSVYQRPNSPFFHYEFMLNGRRYRGSTKQRTATKAKRYEDNRRAEILRRGSSAQRSKAPLLRVVADEFLAEMEKSVEAGNHDSDTLRDYRNGCWASMTCGTCASTRSRAAWPTR